MREKLPPFVGAYIRLGEMSQDPLYPPSKRAMFENNRIHLEHYMTPEQIRQAQDRENQTKQKSA